MTSFEIIAILSVIIAFILVLIEHNASEKILVKSNDYAIKLQNIKLLPSLTLIDREFGDAVLSATDELLRSYLNNEISHQEWETKIKILFIQSNPIQENDTDYI